MSSGGQLPILVYMILNNFYSEVDMELPVLEKFCFIFKLKTGCVVMGLVNMILNLIMGIILMSFAVDLKHHMLENVGKEDGMFSVVYTLVLLLVALLMVKILLDMILVMAVIKSLRFILTHFCIFWIIFVILYSIGFLKTMFHMESACVIAQMMFLAENFYYVIVIRSYLMSIEEE